MNAKEFAELKHWIATDSSDFADRIRAMLRPADSFYKMVYDFGKFDHRHIMRRKIRRCYK